MKHIKKIGAAVAVVLVLGTGLVMTRGAVGTGTGDQFDDYFAGKTVSVSIRSNAGGGYDFHGRLVARHIGKYLPGNPDVIAVNRPGAGGIVAANYAFNQAPKDGTHLVIAAREIAMAEALGESGVMYKTLEMPAIGSTLKDNRVWLVGPDSELENLDVLADFNREALFAVSGLGAGSAQMIQLLEVSGYPVRIVTGYEGTGDQLLAVLRGEVDGMNATYPAQLDIIQDENMKIMAKLGDHPDLAGYTDVRDALEGEYRQLANILGAPLLAGRPFFTAPGTPEPVVAMLREAFRLTMEDPDFIRELERQGEQVGYATPEEMAELYRDTLSAPAHILDLFRN